MDFLIVAVVAFGASALTFFSGFGLGTVLLAAFALFLTAPAAVAATGVVHLLNNLFKGTLVFRSIHWPTALKFGIPAVPAAVLGALALGDLATGAAFTWQAFGHTFAPSAAGMAIGSAMIVFAALEAMPWFRKLALPPGYVPLGGAVSGFMGGMTGQQGALRSLFLLQTGLDGPRFIATGIVVAVFVDLARLPTYAATFGGEVMDLGGHDGALIAVGVAAAFLGAWLGSRYLAKTTVSVIRAFVAGFMLLIGTGMILGVIGA